MPIAWFLGHEEKEPGASQYVFAFTKGQNPYLSQSGPGNRVAKVYGVAGVVVDLWSSKLVHPPLSRKKMELSDTCLQIPRNERKRR